jgi:uncharacterized protein
MRSQIKGVVSVALALLLAGAVSLSRSPVADAAMDGNVDAVQSLLRAGEDVNEPQPDGMTALHWAADRNDQRVARLLLDAGADVTARTRIGEYTPLLVASRRGNVEVIQALLEAGADPNLRTTTAGTSALHFAAASGRSGALRALLSAGADVNAQELSHGHTALMFAAASNQAEAVRILVEAGADPSLTNNVVSMEEISREDAELQRLRNERVAEAQAQREREARIARGEVVVEEIVEVVAEEAPAPGAEEPPVAADSTPAPPREEGVIQPLTYAGLIGGYGGFSALHLAARDGNVEAVRALLEGGAELDQVSGGDGSTALLVATINGHWDLAMELLDRGADPNLASQAGATALYGIINLQWAPHSFYPQPTAQQNAGVTYLEAMERLLKAGADPNVRLEKDLWFKTYNFNLLGVDAMGATPFWRAAYGTDVAAMRLLLEYGADPHIATRTPPQRQRQGGGDETDPSGLPAARSGEPSLTPLHAATGAGYGLGRAGNQHRHHPNGWMAATRFLVEELGMDVNARDHMGYSPLHNASSRGDLEMIQYLVDRGADVTALSRRGQTMADMANGPVQRINPFPEAIELLERLGSKNNNNCQSC